MERKTLANCKLSEFIAQCDKVATIVETSLNDINYATVIDGLREKYQDIDIDEDTTAYIRLATDVFKNIMLSNSEATVRLIAALSFMTYEEAEELDPTEALNIFLTCVFSERVIDFFLSYRQLEHKNSGLISTVLIWLKVAISATKDSSDSQSES